MQYFRNGVIGFSVVLTAILITQVHGDVLSSQKKCTCSCSHPRYDICDSIASIESRVQSSDESLRRYVNDFQRFTSSLNEEIADLVNDLSAKYLASNLQRIIRGVKLTGNSDIPIKRDLITSEKMNDTGYCIGEPPSLENGKPTKFKRTAGSEVRYACDENYIEIGMSTVRCQFGKWQGHPPVCIATHCFEDPPSPENGRPTEFESTPGSEVTYECDENFTMSRNSTVRCLFGKWAGHPPICVESLEN